MQKILIRFLFFFLTIFLTGFNSYSQNWVNNLRSQQLSKGDLNFYDFQNAFYQDNPKDIVKDGYKLVNNQNEKIPYWKLFKRWEWQMESRVDKQTRNKFFIIGFRFFQEIYNHFFIASNSSLYLHYDRRV